MITNDKEPLFPLTNEWADDVPEMIEDRDDFEEVLERWQDEGAFDVSIVDALGRSVCVVVHGLSCFSFAFFPGRSLTCQEGYGRRNCHFPTLIEPRIGQITVQT